jgi:chemotaxis-related protein WspB
MLFLLFQIGKDRYVLDAGQVIEVLPFVRATQIAHAPPAIAGAFTYHGTSVPLVDTSELLLGRHARQRLSTRVVLVRYPTTEGERALGLVAENAIETIVRESTDFQRSGVTTDAAPYLGPVVTDDHGLIQWIETDKLLPPEVADALFAPAVDSQ